MIRLLLALALIVAPAASQTRVWLDADTANEIDDLFALTRALTAPGLDIAALSSVHWKHSPLADGNTLEASQHLNEALLGLLGLDKVPAHRGSHVPLYWWGRDRTAYSGAAYRLMLEARATPPGAKLTVVALGALTNVASALLMDPAIAPRIRLYWLGAHLRDGAWDKSEFNCLNDIHALNEVLNHRELELMVMPASVAAALTFDYEDTARRLQPMGRPGRFLLDRWDRYSPGSRQWIMWDIAAVEWLLNPALVQSKMMRTPPDNTPRDVRVATAIDAAAMREAFWKGLAALGR